MGDLIEIHYLLDVMCSGNKLNEDQYLVVGIERRNSTNVAWDEGISIEGLLNSIWKLRKADGGTRRSALTSDPDPWILILQRASAVECGLKWQEASRLEHGNGLMSDVEAEKNEDPP